MRAISAPLAAHLASGVTTLAHCWRIVRRDGVAMGFTDHDRDLEFGEQAYSALSGLDATQAEAALGLAVEGAEISGALQSASIREEDLSNGAYDGARVESWLVNWSDVSQRHLLDIGAIGEIQRSEYAFTAEIRTLAHAFDQTRGRLFQAGCDAELGDAVCKVSLALPDFSASSSVVTAARSEIVSVLGPFADGWFSGGSVQFTSGSLTGAAYPVKQHRRTGSAHVLIFSTPLPREPVAGDAFVARAGCDKTFRTCREKFSNHHNFRGFPHMPGNDMLTAYPSSGDARMDGGSLLR